MKNNLFTKGIPSETYTMTSTDVSQSIADAKRISNLKNAIAANISVETNDIRFTLGGSTPVVDGLGHTIATTDGIVRLSGPAAVNSFAFVSAATGSAGVLMITLEFEPGTDLT